MGVLRCVCVSAKYLEIKTKYEYFRDFLSYSRIEVLDGKLDNLIDR